MTNDDLTYALDNDDCRHMHDISTITITRSDVCSYVIHVCKTPAVTIMAPKVLPPPAVPAPAPPAALVQDLIYIDALIDLKEKWVLPQSVAMVIYRFLHEQ